MDVGKIKVSMVESCTATQTQDVEIHVVLDAIKKGKWRKQIERIRAVYNNGSVDRREAIKPLKKKLPAVMFSGAFKRRANDALRKHSGYICADLDSLDSNLATVRNNLCFSAHLFAVFVSPSNDGLKAIFKAPADVARHADAFRAIDKHVFDLTGVRVDESGKDPARLCFVSYDPDTEVFDDASESNRCRKSKNQATRATAWPICQRASTSLSNFSARSSGIPKRTACSNNVLARTCTRPATASDCEIHLDGAPNIHCFHNHCAGIVAAVNHELQSRIGKAERVHAAPIVEVVESADDATIARLAALSMIEYEREREDAAVKLGLRQSVLDKLVEAKRPKQSNDRLQGTVVKLPDVELWPEPVDGAEVLDAISECIRDYVVMSKEQADTLALWSAHTHCPTAFQCSPRANVNSPEKGCGKTTLGDVTALFVPRPLQTENLTTAVLFRMVDAHSPTILVDECDAILPEKQELCSLFNAGHRKGAMVYRCEGESNEVRSFRAYTPAMLCGIGALPSTLHDRSIVIRLERAKRGELKKRFDSRHVEREHELRRKLARFCADNFSRLEACDPQLPYGAFNRVADNWRPLFAIAEIAAGDWPQRCANAFAKLARNDADTDSLRVELLSDIRQVFAAERMFSKDLTKALEQMQERPWPEVCRGKPITERWLAKTLGPFGIKSKSMRVDDDNAKGYEKADFENAFARYLPEPPFLSVTASQHEGKPPKSIRHKNKSVTDEKSDPYLGKCDGVTDKKAGNARMHALGHPLIREAVEVFNGKIVT